MLQRNYNKKLYNPLYHITEYKNDSLNFTAIKNISLHFLYHFQVSQCRENVVIVT